MKLPIPMDINTVTLCLGRRPTDEEMTKVNCSLAGTPGHWLCGWNKSRALPVFIAGFDPEEIPPEKRGL